MFEGLLQKLNDCGQVRYEAGAYFIRTLAITPEGFPVKIEWIWDTHFVVFLDGWHQDFDSYEQAVRCFTLAATGHYRLKTASKGSFHFRWTLEYWDGSGWVEDSTITDLFYPFWKPTTTNYLRNDLHCEDVAGESRPAWRLDSERSLPNWDVLPARAPTSYQPAVPHRLLVS